MSQVHVITRHSFLSKALKVMNEFVILRMSRHENFYILNNIRIAFYYMKISIIPFAVFGLSQAFRLRHKGILDDSSFYSDTVTPTPWKYVPSNVNTAPVTSFSDGLTEDRAYHDLPPSLSIVYDLIHGEK